MKAKLTVAALGASLVLLASCKSATKDNFEKQTALEKTKDDIHAKQDEITDKGRALVYGTGYAIAHITNKEPAVEVARNMNDNAQAAIGQATIEDTVRIRQIIDGLLSEGAKERELARKLETQFLGEIILLQREMTALRTNHAFQIDALKAVATANASKAEKWDDLQRKTWYKRIFLSLGFTGTIAAIVALLIFFPAAAPILGRMLAWVVSKFPKMASALGVVATESFDRVVKGVGEIRNSYKKNNATDKLKDEVDIPLSVALDSDDKALINHRREVLKVDYTRN